jgi:hypothetical protein
MACIDLKADFALVRAGAPWLCGHGAGLGQKKCIHNCLKNEHI